MYYAKGWATREQLVKYVEFGVITQEEHDLIINEGGEVK